MFLEFLKNIGTPVLAILTVVYVILTFRIVNEQRKQSDIMLQSSTYIQRAYLNVPSVKREYVKRKYTKLPIPNLQSKFEFRITNQGKTPAYLILWDFKVDSLYKDKFNIRDTLCLCDSFPFEPEIELPNAIMPNHEHPYVYTFSVSTNHKGYFYLHIYFLYKDVFDEYHDYYAVHSFVYDLEREGLFEMFPSWIDIKTFEKEEAKELLMKIVKK